VYDVNGKGPCLTTGTPPKIGNSLNGDWRTLSPLECERLQTLPDNYTLVPWENKTMGNSQRYKQIGNGWTVDVIAHILRSIK